MHAILIGGPMHRQQRTIDDTWTSWEETGLAGDRHRYQRLSPPATRDEAVPVTTRMTLFVHESLSADEARQAIASLDPPAQ